MYQDGAGECRLVAANGNIIADSAEGNRSKEGVEPGIESMKWNAPEAAKRPFTGLVERTNTIITS